MSCVFNTTWVYIHVADVFDTQKEKTYLKARCTPFPGNMSFNRSKMSELERA